MVSKRVKNKVSVIIPTWNRSQTITQAIQSAQAQTYADLEILVCDDFSSDNTAELVGHIIRADPRVRWVPGDAIHRGRPAIPRNRGLKKSSGEWIAFLDSDDTWEKDKLDLQIRQLNKNGLKFSSTNASRIVDGENLGALIPIPSQTLTFKDMWQENKIICSSVLMHSSIVKKIGQMPETKECLALEDYAYWLRALLFSPVHFSEEQLVNYMDNPSVSIRSQAEQNHSLQMKNVRQNLRRWTISEGDFLAKWNYLIKYLSIL